MEITQAREIKYGFMKKAFSFLLAMNLLWSAEAQKSTIAEAHTLLTEGYLEEALDMFNDLEAKNSNNAEFYFLRGTCLSELGENTQAITDFNISISLDKSNADAFYQRGFANFTIGNSEEALKDFNQAIVLNPNYGEAYLNRGTVHYDLGNTEASCKDWQKALDVGLTLAQALIDQLCKN